MSKTFPYAKARKAFKVLSKKEKKQVKQIVDRSLKLSQEVKYTDYSVNANMTDQWTFTQVVLPSSAISDADSRVGDTILPFKMEMRFLTVHGDSLNHCRFVVFRVKAGASTNTYFSIGSTASNAYTVLSPYSHDRRGDIEVLYDSSYVVDTYRPQICKVKNLKLAKKPIQFLGATTTYQKNGLMIAYCSDSDTVPHPQIQMNIRTFYTDS